MARDLGRLLDAAEAAMRDGDGATAQTHLLAAAELLRSRGRADHAAEVQALALAIACDQAIDQATGARP